MERKERLKKKRSREIKKIRLSKLNLIIKNITKKMKRQTIGWEKLLAIYIFDKGLGSTIYNKQLNIKRQAKNKK